ncbi:MAG: hypothetical protein H7Z16_19575 [Pyrinomonadaceae bacterium]|nr:hypothetical protein [Pyrinomonadaceae bacterium]
MTDESEHLIDFDAYLRDLTANSVADHEAEVLLLTCMDFRFFERIARFMKRRGLAGDYDHVILAGAALGAVVKEKPANPAWHQTFFDHLGLAIKLHNIKGVMVLEHRDCGAYSEKGFGFLLPGYTKKEERAVHFEQVQTLKGKIPKNLNFDSFLLNVPKGKGALTFDKLL